MSDNQLANPNTNNANQRYLTPQEQEQRLFIQINNTICSSICMVVFLYFMIRFNDHKTCGNDAEHILRTSIKIKLLFNIPFGVCIKCFIVNKKLSVSAARVILTFVEPI